jgi:uncharacterized repeat protein (TIGR03806 family)
MKRRRLTETATVALRSASLLCVVSLLGLSGCSRGAPYGIAARVDTPPYLGMPPRADGKIPRLLSQTGVFRDTAKQIVNAGLMPYDLNVAFWSDGAEKARWIALPKGRIAFAPTGEWRFPAGTVFVKSFDLPVDPAHAAKRRLETRILVRDADGGVYGVVYKWRADGSDADLLTGGETEEITIKGAGGEEHRQTWYYPSRSDCLTCHTARAGGVLGVKTRQLNRSFTYESGTTDNELRTWNHLGLFDPAIDENAIPKFAALASANDSARSLEDRARSYLDANCAQCHRPGGTVANFDARFDTPLADQALIDGPVLIDQGIDRPRVISPHDIWRSIAYMRVNTNGDIKMPPLARETIDENGVRLLREWIDSLPGRAVLAPPAIAPRGGTFNGPVEVSLTADDPAAEIRYTLDGTVPGQSDKRYEAPIKIGASSVLRARAFKEGLTRSVAVQELFIISK